MEFKEFILHKGEKTKYYIYDSILVTKNLRPLKVK